MLIPVYNAGHYLAASLASITGQTLSDIEIIAVNDGSSDGSGEVLDALAAADSRVRVVHQPNGGIVAALNNGLAVARGRYIARMDGDDIAHADRLEKQVAFLDTNPDYVACGSILRMIDEEGCVVDTQSAGAALPPQTDLSVFPPRVLTVPHPTLMARRDAMVRLGGYRSFFPHAEDHDLFLRLAAFGKIALLQEHLLDYRVHTGAISERRRDIQRESAFKAQAGALLTRLTGEDPFADGRDRTLEELVARSGMPPAAAWNALREVWRLEQDVNRRAAAAGWRQLGVALFTLARHGVALVRVGAFPGVARKAVYNSLRLVRITVRG